VIVLQKPVRRKAALPFQRRTFVVMLESPDLITFRYLRSPKEFTLPLSEVFRIAQARAAAAERAAGKGKRATRPK
jgi:hypothetical protein